MQLGRSAIAHFPSYPKSLFINLQQYLLPVAHEEKQRLGNSATD
ncbi:hypothetical protein [Trichormus variabilis]|nr:hypothetical protein [Trichormus variabilis]